MVLQLSQDTQQLLDRAQRAIDRAIELRAARLRAAKMNRQRFLEHLVALYRRDVQASPPPREKRITEPSGRLNVPVGPSRK